MTRAPALLASRTRIAPRKPIPTMATVCPTWTSLRRKMLNAQPNGSSGSGASFSASGIFTTSEAFATSYCA
jgi:hypothetical protein